MKNRREFLKRGALITTGLVVSAPLLAKSRSLKDDDKDFTGIIFTEKQQAGWDGKAGSHVPKVTVKGNKVTLLTEHGMSETHFIVRHTLVDEAGTMLGAQTFSGTDEKAESTFELPAGFSGKLYATSFCNKHDFWLKEFSV
ncbi:MAG: class II SORL domain-containing protein [Draconibacterium sp.]|nr:class II SORL domain-containing protein [Draconibacterium sp.]